MYVDIWGNGRASAKACIYIYMDLGDELLLMVMYLNGTQKRHVYWRIKLRTDSYYGCSGALTRWASSVGMRALKFGW